MVLWTLRKFGDRRKYRNKSSSIGKEGVSNHFRMWRKGGTRLDRILFLDFPGRVCQWQFNTKIHISKEFNLNFPIFSSFLIPGRTVKFHLWILLTANEPSVSGCVVTLSKIANSIHKYECNNSQWSNGWITHPRTSSGPSSRPKEDEQGTRLFSVSFIFIHNSEPFFKDTAAHFASRCTYKNAIQCNATDMQWNRDIIAKKYSQ